MTVITALPQVINGLLTTLRASSDLAGVRIFDGIEIDGSYPGDFIAIGHDGSDDGEVSVSNTTQSFEQLGNFKQFEDGSIECFLSTWDGGTSITARRARAATLISAVDTALRADLSLGGSCLYSQIASFQFVYLQTTNGAAVNINFTISYRART
jgi:hypothetical protein